MQEPVYSEDAKKDGMFSQIIKRLGSSEKSYREHSSVIHLQPSIIPKRLSVFGEELKVITGVGGSTTLHETRQNYALYTVNTTPGNGDQFSFSGSLRAGNYTFYHYGFTLNSAGKLDWRLDGTLIASGVDWYTLATTYDVVKSFAFTVPFTGFHVFTGTINGTNAASVAPRYYWVVTHIFIVPSSD